MRGRGVVAAVSGRDAGLPGGGVAQEPTGDGTDGDPGRRVHHAQVEPGRGGDRLPDRAHAGRRRRTSRRRGDDRRRLAAAAHDHAGQRRRSRSPATSSASASSGASARASAPARHRQPYSAPVAGHDARPSGPGLLTAENSPDGLRARTPTVRTRPTAEEADFTRRARRRQRPHAGRRARAHAPEPAGEPVHHRLPEAARHRGGDLGHADAGDQLQRARQRGLRPRVVLHDGAPARAQRRPGDPRRC